MERFDPITLQYLTEIICKVDREPISIKCSLKTKLDADLWNTVAQGRREKGRYVLLKPFSLIKRKSQCCGSQVSCISFNQNIGPKQQAGFLDIGGLFCLNYISEVISCVLQDISWSVCIFNSISVSSECKKQEGERTNRVPYSASWCIILCCDSNTVHAHIHVL